jgi:hypothetical protein
MPAGTSEVDFLAYAAWQEDLCPANCFPLYRRRAEIQLLATRHLANGARGFPNPPCNEPLFDLVGDAPDSASEERP